MRFKMSQESSHGRFDRQRSYVIKKTYKSKLNRIVESHIPQINVSRGDLLDISPFFLVNILSYVIKGIASHSFPQTVLSIPSKACQHLNYVHDLPL